MFTIDDYNNNVVIVKNVLTMKKINEFSVITITKILGISTLCSLVPILNQSLFNQSLAQSSRVTQGFYRQQDRPEVYLVYSPKFYCHVQNEDQMAVFGGFGKVRVVTTLNLTTINYTGDCGWPNGFLRRSNEPEVYRMYGSGIPQFNIGNNFCHVINEAQMNAFGGFSKVRVVSPNSDLGRGRTFTNDCQTGGTRTMMPDVQ
ncbi:hypothetical protein [Crocosphaera sp. XPORK-15E]|uniref:hypothetical protein n=1 Tax=Crocosphaera sp. XPORK-15E TaxID=3110247 RepID=UPI002B1FBA3E|nr:hypothetical protein [Crocosphaera sp. XPORK-15E]MEA5535387.1 hypothetical protein [Crocosphaera sp. XPORK-15E]